MKKEFEMSHMGELNYFLGLQIKQLNNGIFINQSKYAKELLKRFGMKNSGCKRTPMATTDSLHKDENEKSVDPKIYRGMIGSLLYLTASRHYRKSGQCRGKFPSALFISVGNA